MYDLINLIKIISILILFYFQQEVAGHKDILETLKKFKDTCYFLESINSVYETLNNILQTELEKHKHEPNFGKFDWQITGKFSKTT